MSNKEKVLLIAHENFTMTEFHQFLEQYTINNGVYPDFIDMPEKNVQRYISLLLSPVDENNITLHGIKIRKI